MKKLSANLRTLLIMGVKRAGSYSVPEVFAAVEEQMTMEEAKLAEGFLTWLTEQGLQFGHGNLDQRWNDWQLSLGDQRPAPAPAKAKKSMHAQLGLPSHYRVHTAVEGYIGNTHYGVRLLRTDALGQHAVHAMSVSWGEWQKVTGDQFMNIAKQVLGVHPHGELTIS